MLRFPQLMRFRATAIPALLLLLALFSSRGQESQPSEYQIKAAFLYHFAQFIEWPAASFVNPTSPMVIGVLGENPFGDVLQRTVLGKTLNNHPFVIKEFRSQAEATTNCHILFVSTSEKQRLTEIFSTLRGASVLTVGETDGFTEMGGMINFVLQEKKIRFQINDEAAKIAGLKIRSKLLSLAITPTR